MSTNESGQSTIDWSRATYRGATREAMRRWSELPLEQILAAQEEMAALAEAFGHDPYPAERKPGAQAED